MKLRLVPEDELEEIGELLESRGLEYYTTSAGNWGISLPALWLLDDGRADEARALLEDYAVRRRDRARELQAALKESGRQRTVLDIARENPLRWLLYVALIAGLIYVSTAPFFGWS